MTRFVCVLVLWCVIACGSSQAQPGDGVPRGLSTSRKTAGPNDRGSNALGATHIAVVPGGTYGPYLGERPGSLIAAWAAPSGEGRDWLTVPVRGSGDPASKARRIAPAAAEVGLVALKALALDDGKAGFVLVTSSREFQGVRVDAIALGPNGELRGGPVPIAQSLPDVVWLDAIPTRTGAIVLWAVKKGQTAEIVSLRLGPAGNPERDPVVVIPEARAWQAAPAPRGVAVAAVTPAADGRPQGSDSVTLAFVDEKGELESKPRVIVGSVSAEPDLDLAPIGERFVLAWSDRTELEPRVVTVVVDAQGRALGEPKPLTRALGPQALIRLVASAKPELPGFVVWENLAERPDYGRQLRVASLSSDGTLTGKQGVLEFAGADGGVPDFSATANGLAALTLSPACHAGKPCNGSESVPTFVLFDRKFDAVASEPIRLQPLGGRFVDLVWGLTCSSYECLALAAEPRSPARVFTVQLAKASRDWRPAGWQHTEPEPPRPRSISAIARTPPLSDLVATRAGDRTLVAWLTYFDPAIPYERPKSPAPDGRYAPVRAVLSVRSLSDAGDGPPPDVVSYRARSVGGLAIAGGDDGQALLVWAAIENNLPQVFTTLLDSNGQKLKQKMLTHSKGDVGDVSAAFVGDGWVVGWIDETRGHPEVRVAKLDPALNRVGPERALTHAVGSASQVQLVALGQHVFAVWTDARGKDEGVGEIFTARLSAQTGEALGPERQITRTRAHSHSPAVAAFGEGALVAWLEEGGEPDSRGKVRVMIQRLDSGAEPASRPVLLDEEVAPASVSLTCNARECRAGTLTWSAGVGQLRAVIFDPADGTTLSRRLASLSRRSHDNMAPALAGDAVFYPDTTADDSTLIHRMEVQWH